MIYILPFLLCTDQCKLEMLIAWLNQETPPWPRVISALGEMEMTELALTKYGRMNHPLKRINRFKLSFFLVQGIPAPLSLNEALEWKAESARMVERQVCSLCCPLYVDEKVPVCEYKNLNKIMFGDYGKLDATHSK